MLTALRQFVDLLDRHANLLLVIVTATYVGLTWQNLKALQRASLRERELRHLDDIKRYVVRPILEWLDEAVKILSGSNPLIVVKTLQVPRKKPTIGEPDYDYRNQLNYTLGEPPVIWSRLFSHAREIHFPKQLSEFQVYLGKVQEAVRDCAVFARDCAAKIASSTTLPRLPVDGKVTEAADSDLLVEVCLRDIFLERPKPRIEIRPSGPEALEAYDSYTNRPLLGKGPSEPLTAWVGRGISSIKEELHKSGLRGRLKALLRDAAIVRQTLEALEFTYDLVGDCEYIGGKTPGILKRFYGWLKTTGRSFRH